MSDVKAEISYLKDRLRCLKKKVCNLEDTGSIETDPIFSASPAFGITNIDITNWNTAYTSIPTNYVTTNSTQTGLSGDKTWTGLHTYTAPYSTGQISVGSIGQGAKLNFIEGNTGVNAFTIGYSLINGTQAILNSISGGGITMRNTNNTGFASMEGTGTSTYLNFLSSNLQTMRMQNGRVRIGTTTTDDTGSTLRVDGVTTVAGDILPEALSTRNLGGSTLRYANVYANTVNANNGTLTLRTTGGFLFQHSSNSNIIGGFFSVTGNFYLQAPATQPSDLGYRLYVGGTSYHAGDSTFAGNVLPEANGTRTVGSSGLNYNSIFTNILSSTSGLIIEKAASGGIHLRNSTTTNYFGGWFPTTGNTYLQSPGTLPTDDLSGVQISHSITASSAIARGVNIKPTLIAAANNDVLVGLDINPTFTNGAFTGVSNYAVRIGGSIDVNGSVTATNFNGRGGALRLFTGATGNPASFRFTGTTDIFSHYHITTGNLSLQAPGTAPTDLGYRLQNIGTYYSTGLQTLSSTSTGIRMFNTSDETTNTETGNIGWTGNVFNISTLQSGTGNQRNLAITSGGAQTTITANNTTIQVGLAAMVGMVNVSRSLSTDNVSLFGVRGTQSSNTGPQFIQSIIPTIVQSGVAGYTTLFISPYEQSTGSGVKNLIDVGTNSAASGGGTHTSKFSVSNTGSVKLASTSSGFVLHNLSTEVTDTEQGNIGWNSNVFTISTTNAGTGASRNISIAAAGSMFLSIGGVQRIGIGTTSETGGINLSYNTASSGAIVGINPVLSGTSATSKMLSIVPTINKTGSGDYTGLYMSVYEQSVPSGSKNLIELGTNTAANNGGTHSSKFNVSSAGLTQAVQYKLSALNTAPSSATDTGVLGEIRWSNGFVYLCTATNTWLRVALTTW